MINKTSYTAPKLKIFYQKGNSINLEKRYAICMPSSQLSSLESELCSKPITVKQTVSCMKIEDTLE